MSASIAEIIWNSPIARPNCFRSRAYFVATSSAPWAIPTAWAAIPGRERSNVCIAIANPSPSAPSTVGGRDADLVEDELGGGGAADPHLVLEARDPEAGPVGLDDEAGEPVVAVAVGIGQGEDGHEVGHRAVADEALGAGDAGSRRRRARRACGCRHVGAGLGLGDARMRRASSRREVGDPALLLLLGPGEQDRQGAEPLYGQDQAGRRADPADLLDREAGGRRSPPSPPSRSGNGA